MAAPFSRLRSFCCLALLLAGAAGAQQSPGRGGSPVTASPQGADQVTRVATALRDSTRLYPANHVPDIALLKEFLTGAHTGPVDGAVMGVEVTNQAKGGETETHRCSGLLLRCDGFFLLPPAVTSLGMSNGADAVKQTLRVIVHPGAAGEQRAVAYLRHYIVDGIDMTVMKAQDVHAPAARPLLPDSLKTGEEVELVWTEWDAAAQRFSAVKRRKASLGAQPASDAERKRLAWRPGEILLSEMQDAVPGGAAVIGPDGMAIGILPGSTGRHDRFVSFAGLARITNCVAAAPTTDAEFARLSSAGTANENGADPAQNGTAAGGDPPPAGAAHPVNSMIDVPGGPVRLPSLLLDDQRDMCGEIIACVPAFKIDKYKVSNREYYDFWMSLPKADRENRDVRAALYPVAWAVSDPPFPPEIDDTPVLGVPVSGARAYARSKGKRLATTYEWTRAAFGPFGGYYLPPWINEYMLDRQQAWARIAEQHENYARSLVPERLRKLESDRLERAAAEIDRRPPPVQEPDAGLLTIPFFDPKEKYSAACLWSVALIDDEVKRLCDKWIRPLYVLPAGSRPYDVSPFGVMDMILNGNERVEFLPETNRATDDLLLGRPHTMGISLNTLPMRELRTPSQMGLMPLIAPPSIVDQGSFERIAGVTLLTRRLVSGSSRIRPQLREFNPIDAEKYTQYRARIYEEMMMALPIVQVRVMAISHETVTTDSWGQGTVKVTTVYENPKPLQSFGFKAISGFAIGVSHHVEHDDSLLHGDLLGKRFGGFGLVAQHNAVPLHDWRVGTMRGPLEFQLPSTLKLGGTLAEGVRLDDSVLLFLGIYFDETWFYPKWGGVSPFTHREMGRDAAMDPPEHIGEWPVIDQPLTQPPDTYLIPNGFRCAR